MAVKRAEQSDEIVVRMVEETGKPQTAVRVRWNMNTDTPLPPDVAAGQNPPDGAILNYYLKSNANGPVTLEVKDAPGNVIRRYSSTDPAPQPDPMLEIPRYWLRPPQLLSSEAGLHRFIWDMHLAPLPGIRATYPIAAIAHNTPPDATSPWAMTGTYTLVLTANGKSYSQPLKITMDPRVRTPAADLQQQFQLSKQLYDSAWKLSLAINQATALRAQLKDRKQRAGEVIAGAAIEAFAKQLDVVAGEGGGRRGRGGPQTDSLASVRGSLLTLMGILQDADVAPTAQSVAAIAEIEKKVPVALGAWDSFQKQDLAAFNQQLRSANIEEVKID